MWTEGKPACEGWYRVASWASQESPPLRMYWNGREWLHYPGQTQAPRQPPPSYWEP